MGAEERAESFSGEAGRSRKIIHIDMDAFYASVEQRDNPELREKPVAVGGSRERGVVAAAIYEARKVGVHSAMPSITAKRKCPNLIFVKPRFDAYKAISLQIQEIFAADTPIIEPLSLDDGYLDGTSQRRNTEVRTSCSARHKQRFRGFGRVEADRPSGWRYHPSSRRPRPSNEGAHADGGGDVCPQNQSFGETRDSGLGQTSKPRNRQRNRRFESISLQRSVCELSVSCSVSNAALLAYLRDP